MNETDTGSAPRVDDDPQESASTIAQIAARNAATHPERVTLRVREGAGWRDVTSAQFWSWVRRVAKGFLATGIEPGDRVAIMSRTRAEWTVADFALWTVGAVGVPIYETSSVEQVRWILQDSGAVAVVVESARHALVVEEARSGLPVRQVWCLDDDGLGQLETAGEQVDEATLDARVDAGRPGDLATLIYTSGTTGRPKGCELTHANFVLLSRSAGREIPEVFGAGATTLLFLPLAHVFARYIQVLAIDQGVALGHSPDVKTLLPDLAGFQPTFVLAVPRVFEKIYTGIEANAEGAGRQRIFHWASRIAISYSRALDGGTVPRSLRAGHRIADALVYRKLRAAMGGRIMYAVSGGAPLGERLGHFFRGAGITILEGYGLTETTAPITVNRPATIKIGTVGPPLPGVDVRIAEDGEIQVKGINVLAGYWRNDEATAAAFDGPWFRTGDLGALDDDGVLRITGRTKEIIVTAGGKNVAPSLLEDRMRSHPLVSQAVVVGDQRPFIGALLTLDDTMWESWARQHGVSDLTLEQARTDPRVCEELQKAVDHANEAVSKAESVRKFVVLDRDFTEENGYLTPSMKVKRNLVTRDFGDVIDDLYGGPVPQQR